MKIWTGGWVVVRMTYKYSLSTCLLIT